MAPPAIVSAEYADHENKAANVVYDNDKRRYVMMNSNSKHKRDLDAWVAEGNEIEPCPLPPGVIEQPLSQQTEALEERVAELELGLKQKSKQRG